MMHDRGYVTGIHRARNEIADYNYDSLQSILQPRRVIKYTRESCHTHIHMHHGFVKQIVQR